jgi:hypothetical protein
MFFFLLSGFGLSHIFIGVWLVCCGCPGAWLLLSCEGDAEPVFLLCSLLSWWFAYNHQDSKEHSKKTGSASPSHESNSHVPGQPQQTNHTPMKIWDNQKPDNRKKNINALLSTPESDIYKRATTTI